MEDKDSRLTGGLRRDSWSQLYQVPSYRISKLSCGEIIIRRICTKQSLKKQYYFSNFQPKTGGSGVGCVLTRFFVESTCTSFCCLNQPSNFYICYNMTGNEIDLLNTGWDLHLYRQPQVILDPYVLVTFYSFHWWDGTLFLYLKLTQSGLFCCSL